MRNISKTALLMLLLSKVSLSFAATTSYPAPVPVTGESSSTVGSASGAAWPKERFVSGRGATESCVTDKLTGLMWSKNANLFVNKMSWKDADAAVTNMNSNKAATANKLCGYSDWHLPTNSELKSLINYGTLDLAEWLNGSNKFTDVMADSAYWSSTSYARDTNSAWSVDFGNGGFVYSYPKGYGYYVWPVRRAE